MLSVIWEIIQKISQVIYMGIVILVALFIIVAALTTWVKANDKDKLKLILHQESYCNTATPQFEPQPIHELVSIAKSKWKFDGIMLSMDGLINEAGTDNKQYRNFVKQLAVDLDSISISRLHQHSFKIYLDLDFKSELTDNLDKDFLVDATMETLHRLDISGYIGDATFIEQSNTTSKVRHKLVVIPSGKDFVNSVKVSLPPKKELRQLDLLVLKASQPLRYSVEENGVIGMGSPSFEGVYNDYNKLLRK